MSISAPDTSPHCATVQSPHSSWGRTYLILASLAIALAACALLPDDTAFMALRVALAWPALGITACLGRREGLWSYRALFLLLPPTLMCVYIVHYFLAPLTLHTLLLTLRDLTCLLAAALALSLLARLCRALPGLLRHLSWLLLPPLLLCALIPAGYLLCFSLSDSLITDNDILAALNTDKGEANGYLQDHLGFPLRLDITFLCLLSYLTGAVMLTTRSLPKPLTLRPLRAAALLLAPLMACAACFGTYLSIPYTAAYETSLSFVDYAQGAPQRAQILTAARQSEGLPATLEHGTYVLIIGESESRDLMAAFGFTEADDTPHLSALLKQSAGEDAAVLPLLFTEGYSCHAQTVENLTYALTAINQYAPPLPGADNPSLIEILRHRYGFNTLFISNQTRAGRYSSPVTAIGALSDYVFFTKKTGPIYLDEELLPALQQAPLGPRDNLIIIHLMGSHYPYTERYPQRFEYFRSEGLSDLGEYLNTVLYTDDNLHRIAQWAQSLPNFRALLYFSDHGEDVFGQRRHQASLFDWNMTHIPLLFELSKAYASEQKTRTDALRSHQDTPFTNDLIFDTVLGLIGATDNPWYQAQNDLASPSYDHTRADLKTMHGLYRLSEESRPCTPDCDKIWLHRVDSPQKLTELGEKYPGLELDLIYYEDAHAFENTHYDASDDPKVLSLKDHPLSATLEAYQAQGRNQYLWLDLKNLTPQNASAAASDLKALLSHYRIALNRVFIENQDAGALAVLHEAGLNTLFWFPYLDLPSLSAAQQADVCAQLRNIAASGSVDGISFSGEYYDFIKSCALPPTVPLYTWFLGLAPPYFEQSEPHLALLRDPAVRAVLLEQFGHHHR